MTNEDKKKKTTPGFDLKKYVGPRFIKPDHVRNEPIRTTINGVRQGKFEKLELVLDDGDVLSLNATNTEVLMNAYGRNSKHLVDKEIELYFGQLRYNGADNDAVLVRPISLPEKIDMDDEIPF
jgi:hypothetical protein